MQHVLTIGKSPRTQWAKSFTNQYPTGMIEYGFWNNLHIASPRKLAREIVFTLWQQ
jgi:hypothetical protein